MLPKKPKHLDSRFGKGVVKNFEHVKNILFATYGQYKGGVVGFDEKLSRNGDMDEKSLNFMPFQAKLVFEY